MSLSGQKLSWMSRYWINLKNGEGEICRKKESFTTFSPFPVLTSLKRLLYNNFTLNIIENNFRDCYCSSLLYSGFSTEVGQESCSINLSFYFVSDCVTLGGPS